MNGTLRELPPGDVQRSCSSYGRGAMRIGFTGTRRGMTPAQKTAFRAFIERSRPTAFRHGCCVGADADAAEIVREILGAAGIIIGHPSDIPAMTSRAAELSCGEVHPPEPPLDRNRIIVDHSEVLVACPNAPEKLRSGTWATVRYARRTEKRNVIIWPDGTCVEEN